MQNSTAIRKCDVDTVRIISIKGISKVGISLLSDLGRPGKSYIHQFPQSVSDWQSALYCSKSDISTQTRDSAAVFQPKRAPQTSSGVVYILWTLTKIGCLLVTWVRLFYIGSVTTAYGSSLGLGSPIYGLSLGSGITIYSLSLPYKVCHLG